MNNSDFYIAIARTYYPKQTLGLAGVYYKNQMIFPFKTLELPWLQNQHGISCVPEGEYPLVREYSPKFNCKLLELKEVPDRTESKIHPANYTSQLRGCIAPGLHFVDMNSDGLKDVMFSGDTVQFINNLMPDKSVIIITSTNAQG